jgi:RNA polymerase sigma-70 factor, ECF subfamily
MRSNQGRGGIQSDSELVARLAAGDELALGELYDAYGGVAYSLAYAMTGDRRVAERIVEDAFLQAKGEAHAFDASRVSVVGWLTSLVRGRALVVCRAGRASAARRAPWALREQWRLEPSYCENGVARDTFHCQSSAARTALSALTGNERRAVELAYFGGLTIGEVAATMEESESGVHRLLGSAMSRLRLTLSTGTATPDEGVGVRA